MLHDALGARNLFANLDEDGRSRFCFLCDWFVCGFWLWMWMQLIGVVNHEISFDYLRWQNINSGGQDFLIKLGFWMLRKESWRSI